MLEEDSGYFSGQGRRRAVREFKRDPERCYRIVATDAWSSRQCSRKGVIEEDGRLWCKQHAPSAVRERTKQAEERMDREIEQRCQWDMDRAWSKVIAKLRKMDPKLAEQVDVMAKKSREADEKA